MAQNSKQRRSNLGYADYFTGKCPVGCEQCFVNYGQHEHLVNTMHPKWAAWARKMGWKGSAALIPKVPQPAWTHWKKTIIGPDNKSYPFFLRACCMSEATFAPDWWTLKIKDVWGDFCFFNSTIRAIMTKKLGGLGHEKAPEKWHKVVVTSNGGFQKPNPNRKRLLHTDRLEKIRHSFGARRPGDFLAPRSLSQVGLTHFEDRVKFYRLRAMPTIRGRLEVEAPVVITPLRFKSVFYLLAHARKYGFGVELETGNSSIAKDALAMGISPVHRPGRTLARVWSHGQDNSSSKAGEATTYMVKNGWYKPLPDWDDEPFVCDRAGKGCGYCGLCASLDGTFAHDAWNRLNPIPPLAFTDYYYPMDASGASKTSQRMAVMENPNELDETFFARFLETIAEENPGASVEEKPDEWLDAALHFLGRYYNGGFDGEGDIKDVMQFEEGWNTWEEAETLLAYVWWCLLRQAVRRGLSPEQAVAWAITRGAEASGLPAFEVMVEGIEDADLIWEDEGRWVEQFGSVINQ